MKKDLYPFKHLRYNHYIIGYCTDVRGTGCPYPERFLDITFGRAEVNKILSSDDFTAAVDDILSRRIK